MYQYELVKLVGLTLEAADDPLAWEAFFTKFAESVHADAAGLIIHDKAGRWMKSPVSVGVDPSMRKAYEENQERLIALNPGNPEAGFIQESSLIANNWPPKRT
jgi:hypothetical protein